MKDTIKLKKLICFMVVIAFIILIIPIIYVGMYNHPSNDDFFFGIRTVHAWRETGSFFAVIGAALEETLDAYQTWQGSFSAIFLFAIHPAIFSQSFYWLCTPILLTVLTGSILLFVKVVLGNYLHSDNYTVLITGFFLAGICIQLMPSPVQGIFWWNGSIYYTFFYSLSILMFSFCLLGIQTQRIIPRIFYGIITILLAFIVGGGNQITGLVSLLFLLMMIAWQIHQKNKHIWIVIATFLALGITFYINLASPGNAERMSSYPNRPTSILQTILMSMSFALNKISVWTTPIILASAVLLGCLFYSVVSRVNFHFKYPVLVLVLSFCLFAAHFAPTTYGMGSDGAGRSYNIYFYSYIFLIAMNIFYFSGWLHRKLASKLVKHKILLSKGVPLMIAVFLLIGIQAIVYKFNNDPEDWTSEYVSLSAIYTITSGEAKQYDKEYKERLVVLEDPELQVIEFQPFSCKPYLLFYMDMTEDPDWMWANKPIREYFDKESVIVTSEENR